MRKYTKKKGEHSKNQINLSIPWHAACSWLKRNEWSSGNLEKNSLPVMLREKLQRKMSWAETKKSTVLSLCCIRNGYKCNNLLKITHRDMVSAFSICYFENIFLSWGMKTIIANFPLSVKQDELNDRFKPTCYHNTWIFGRSPQMTAVLFGSNKANRSCYQLLLECSSFVRLTPKTLVTNALNSNVDELRIWCTATNNNHLPWNFHYKWI